MKQQPTVAAPSGAVSDPLIAGSLAMPSRFPKSSSRHSSSASRKQQMGSSPSQSSLVLHAVVPAGSMDRSMGQLYSNPQLADDLDTAARAHSLSAQSASFHARSAQSSFPPNSFTTSSSFSPVGAGHSLNGMSPAAARFINPRRMDIAMDEEDGGGCGGGLASEAKRGGGIDPTPLLSGSASPSSPSPVPPPASDPHKPVRRWLFDFPVRLNSFFYRFDNVICSWVQAPLSTWSGGLTTSLEEEILESDEQSRREEERRRKQHRKAGGAPTGLETARASAIRNVSGSTVLQRSMAITWRNKLLVGLALSYTAITTIELGVVCPLFFFLIGLDNLATEAVFAALAAAVISQTFKRFVWRPRPWMTGRSIQVKRDLTSSFPSRAVICAVVYSYLFAHIFFPPHSVPWMVIVPTVVLFALGAAISRIFVGAHYASDCVFGFLIGASICVVGSLLNRGVEEVCGPCYAHDLCYAASWDDRLTMARLSELNLLTFTLVTGVSLLAVVLAMSSPLNYWTKCLPIFGLLTPCMAFRVIELCPRHTDTGVALLKMEQPSAGVIVAAAVISFAGLLFAKGVNKLITTETAVQLNSPTEMVDVDGVVAEHSAMHPHGADAVAARLFLQCSPCRTAMWNLGLFFFVFALIFLALSSWRIQFAKPENY